MIIQENIEINGNNFIHTFSDSNKYIIQNETNILYEDAIDIPNTYTYVESEENITPEEDPENLEEEVIEK
jgi:hypothetical protein